MLNGNNTTNITLTGKTAGSVQNLNTNNNISNNGLNAGLTEGVNASLTTMLYGGIVSIKNWVTGSTEKSSNTAATNPPIKQDYTRLEFHQEMDKETLLKSKYYNVVTKTKKLSHNIKLKNSALNTYSDATNKMLGADANNLTYGQKVMFGILVNTNDINTLIKENKDVEKFLSKYLGIEDLNSIAHYNDNFVSSFLISCTSGAVIGGMAGFAVSKITSYIRNPYSVVGNNDAEVDVESQALHPEAESRAEVTPRSFPRNIGFAAVGGAVGCVAGIVGNTIYQLSQGTSINLDDIIKQMITENAIQNIDAQNITTTAKTCLNAINDDVNSIMHDMKFPEEYKPLVYDIFHKECSVYYTNEQHAQDNIFQRLNRLKTEEIMVTNNMPTANEELFENAYNAFVEKGESGILELKKLQNNVNSKSTEFINENSLYNNPIANHNRKLLSIPENTISGEFDTLQNAYSKNPIAKEHINNLKYFVENTGKQNITFNKREAEAFNYFADPKNSFNAQQYPKISEIIKNVSPALKLYNGIYAFLPSEAYMDNKINEWCNELTEYYVDAYQRNNIVKRGVSNAASIELEEEKLDENDIKQIIKNIQDGSPIKRLPRAVQQNYNSVGTKLTPTIESKVKQFLAQDVTGEVIEEASEIVIRKIKEEAIKKVSQGFQAGICRISGARRGNPSTSKAGISAGKSGNPTTTKKGLKAKIKQITPQSVAKGMAYFGKQVAIGLAVEAVIGVIVEAHRAGQSAQVKNDFNDFKNALAKNIYNDLELYATSHGYTSVKSMFIEISKTEVEEEREALYGKLLDHIKQSYEKHIAQQIVFDTLKEGDNHDKKIILSALQASLSFISLIGGPIGVVAGIAGSIPASSFFNPELTVTNECFKGSTPEQMFEYVNSITFIGGFFEVANNVINAENFVNHRYNVTESECEVGMKNAKQKVLEDCKNTQFVGLHNKYPNLYALTQYKRHDSKTIETLANINNIANSNVQAHYSPEYFSSPEEQRIENKKNADFATYVAENTDYENINSKIIKIEKNITQTRSSIAIARYVNQEFNELVRTQYPQFYYDIESAESIFCIENTGANSSPDCIGYGERKLEDIAKQAYKDIKILDRSSNELQDLYKQKTDIVTKLSNNFQQTNAYTQYKGDIATAKNNNNNGQYIEFYNKVNAWKQSVGTNLTEINLDTFTEIESNFGKMYGEFEILLENLNTLDASPQEKKLMQEVLNGQFASYAQVFLVASNRLNDNMKKSNNRHVYISPVVAFLKKKGALNVAHKDGFDDFKQSSNEQGASVDSQVLYNNQQLLKGVIENSQWPYWLTSGNDFVISSKCEANKALRPILASAGRGETSTSTCHGQMKGCGEDGIKGVKNDRSCQTAGQVITESKLKDKYEYPGFSDNQIDDMLMFRFSSIADPRQNVEVTVHQGVVNHVWPYQGTWFYERFSKIFGAVDYIKKGTTFSNALGSKIVDPKSPESTRLKEYIKSGRELDSNMHDLITLNTHPEFFTAYFTVMQTIEYDRSKNSNNAKLNNDPTLQTQIDGLNQQYVITNNNPFTTCLILSFDKNNINYNPANISNYTEYLSSYYIVRRGLEVLKTMNQNSIALSNAAKITGILHLKTISKECGPVDTYNKNNPETFKDTLSSLEPYMREFGVPVFEVNGPTNKAGKMNVSAVLSLIGVISPDGIKEMPALTSGDSSIYIPKGLFSQEKMRDYANQLMPEIKSPNDYKAFIFGQCTNAIVTGNLKKSKECVTVLKAMQLEAVPNNPYFFDQIGNFIKEANKLIKTIDASYIIPEEVIFDVEHAKQLIKEPLKPNLAERIFVFHQLTKIQNTLLDLTNTKNHLGALSSIKTIHEKIANSLNALESKIALLLALGYKNIATYEKETNTFANINHDLIEKIQKSCPYFHSYESIKPNYATAINLYNNIGYYTSEASLSSYITAIHGAMLRDYYNNKLPKTDPLITEFSTYKTITEIFSTLETAFKQSITQPKKAMEFQRMMAYLYNFYINRSDLIAGVNIELFGNDLFHGDKINYLGLAKAFLPTSSTNLEKLNDVYPEAIKQIVTNNNNYNDYKQWLNTQNLTPDVKALALKVLETTEVAPSSIKLDLNIYNNEQSKDIKKYNQFVSSLSGNDFDSKIVKRHIHTLKSVFSLGSPLKVFNIATLAILLDDGLINRGDIQDANGKDASKSAKALAKIKTLIKTYQKYAEFDTSVTPYTLSPIQQEGINTAFNGNIPTSVPTIANVDATLDNNFISIPNRQKLTSEGRTYYKIKLNKEAGIKALTNLLEICNIHNAALVDFQTRFYHPNTDANKLHKQFSDFSKNLAQTLGKFEDLELASRNHENILNFKARVVTVIENFKSEYNDITIKSPYLIEPYNPFIDHFDKHKKFSEFKKNLVQILVKSINPVVKEWMGAMIENFNSAYNDATNKGAYRLGLNNPLTNQFYNKDVIAINPIKNPYFEYNLDLLKKKIVRKARSASDVEMSDENNNVEMEIEDGTNVNLQDVAEKYPDTMIWIKMKNGQNQIITINKNNILSLRSEINALDSTNIEQIDIETPDRIFTRDGNGVTRKALLPTVIESILRAQDSNVKNIPIQHIFYDDFGNRQYADSSNLDYKYYNLVSLNKIYAQKAREDMSAELSTLLTKHGIDKAEFANFIKSTSEIDVEASKYGPLLKDVALSSNRFKNFVLSKIKYNSNITIGESQNSNAKVDLALGELEIHIPKFENILSYNDKQKSQLLGILQYYDKSVTLTTEMQAPNNADFAKMKAIYVQEISNMQSMYDGIDDADIHKIHAKLFLDTMNILVDKGTTSTIGALKTHFTNFLKKNQSISSNQIANIVNAINGYFFDNVTDLESFAAISSNIAISILGKDSSGINNAIGAINNFALPNDPNTYSDALTNNLNWLLSSKVIEQAKTLSNPFKLSMIAREQADKMEMDMLLGETGVTDDVSYLMSNIGTDLFPISYQTLAPSGRGEFIDSNFLPKSILPVQENIPDTKMPTIATSILLSAFNGHNAVLEGVRYLFNKVSGSVTDDELRKLKTVFYDSNRIKTSKSKVGSEINNAIRTVLANNNHNQISFLIETHGLPGTKVLGDDNHEWKMMNLDMGTNVNDPANFIYLFDQVVKQRIDNQNKNIPQSKTLDVRFNLHACQAAQPSNDFRKQTGLSDAFPITTINDSALSNMKLALDEYASKNSADLKKAGINDVILTGFYGEVYINPIGMNSQTLNTNTGSYLRLSKNFGSGGSSTISDEWGASHHNIQNNKKVLGKKTPNLPSKPGNCLGS